jgi:quercetin dioxygenase-like cupin family protein
MTVTCIDTNDLDWEAVPDSWKGKAAESEAGVRFKRFPTGFSPVPFGMVVEFEPGHHESEHSHPEDELFFVLEGEMHVSGRRASAGTLLFIEAGTRYAIDTGDEGARYLRLQDAS